MQARVVCTSKPQPTTAAADISDVCRSFPLRHQLNGLGGKVLCLGDQFLLLLEGPQANVDGAVRRIERRVPDAGMTVRVRDTCEERAFRTLSIGEVYLDEVKLCSSNAAESLLDSVIDLLAGAEPEGRDLFAEVATQLDRFAECSPAAAARHAYAS